MISLLIPKWFNDFTSEWPLDLISPEITPSDEIFPSKDHPVDKIPLFTNAPGKTF